MLRQILTLIVVTLWMAGCSILPDWLGDSNEKKLKGERIAVLKTEAPAQENPELADVPVLVPKPIRTEYWLKSTGYTTLSYPNPRIPEHLSEIETVSAGKGGSKGQPLMATPIVAQGKVFTLDSSGRIMAFDAKNINKRLWEVSIKLQEDKGNFANGGVAYMEGRLYVNTGTNQVVAMDAATGKEVWRRTIQSIARSAPAVQKGRVFVNTIQNTLYALDANTGGILWTHTGVAEDISILGSASPATSDGVVISPYSSGELYTLREDTGEPIWFDNLTGGITNVTYNLSDIDASPVVSQNHVFAVSSDGVLVAEDLYSGERLWEQDISGVQTPWVVGNFLYLISDTQQLICVHVPSGGVKWVHQLPAYENQKDQKDPIGWSGPVMAGNRLLVVSSNGKLLVVSPVTGKIKESIKVPDNITLPPVVALDTVYLYTQDAKLVSLSGGITDAANDDLSESVPAEPKAGPASESHTLFKKPKMAVSPMLKKMIGVVTGDKADVPATLPAPEEPKDTISEIPERK